MPGRFLPVREPARILLPYAVTVTVVLVVLAAAMLETRDALAKAREHAETEAVERAGSIARSVCAGETALIDTTTFVPGVVLVGSPAAHSAGVSGLSAVEVAILQEVPAPGTLPEGLDPLLVGALEEGSASVTEGGSIRAAACRRGHDPSGRLVAVVVSQETPFAITALQDLERDVIPWLFVVALLISTPAMILVHLALTRRRTELETFGDGAPPDRGGPGGEEPERLDLPSVMREAVKTSASGIGLIILDPAGGIVSLNRSAAELLDGTQQEFMGHRVQNSPCFGSMAREMLAPAGDPSRARDPLLLRVERADGGSSWIRTGRTYFTGPDGAVLGLMCMVDVTELEEMRAEKEKLLEREMAVNSYAVLAAMVRGFSHDLNNLLSGIMGAASLGDAVHDPGSPDRQRYEAILGAAERAAGISEELLHSASLTESQARPLDTARELNEIGEALRSVLPRSISLEVSVSGGMPFLIADRALLRQTLYNLALRSSGALQGSGRIRLWAEDVPDPSRDSRFAGSCRSLCGIHCICVSTSDGTVFPAGLQKSLSASETDPYEIEKSHGAGMAAVLQAVRAMKGQLCFGVERMGTVVNLLLPAAERMETPAGEGDDISGSNIAVLVAEEEGIVRETTSQILQHFGFRTAEATTGDEALAILEHEHFDALLLDLGAFGTPSIEIAGICRERWPGMAVLFTSGYEMPVEIESFLRGHGGAGFLRKPYFPEAVASEIIRLVSRDQHPGGTGWAGGA